MIKLLKVIKLFLKKISYVFKYVIVKLLNCHPVLNEILSTLANRPFITDMFSRSVGLDSQLTVKSLLEKIVHSSIMRLGSSSIDKLYELIFMSVKYQMFTATEPQQLFDITLAHIESWSLMTDDPEILLQIQHAQSLLISTYKNLSAWTWMDIRNSLLNYLLPNKTRVTIFLKRGYQDPTKAYFRLDLEREFPPSIGSLPNIRPYESLASSLPSVDRVTRLGTNMFNDSLSKRNATSGIKTLDRTLLGRPSASDTSVADNIEPQSIDSISNLRQEEETIQLQWAPAASDQLSVQEDETLLDLFDQAQLLLNGDK